ncbi:uncharacterized protein [Antedon mediterranea]|uniref:uncharacterized protein isoform X2 n=1 Tax=Antedon mediterranea TaxID=105859 RepID=UPI003AF5E77A
MSERAGLTNKVKDGKTKYSSLNLYDTYKGDTNKPQRPTVSHGRGLQSLGKVGSSRRVPPPAVLPSLRSESGGNDPNINLVPDGGAGWKSKDKRDTSSPPVHLNVVSHQGSTRPDQPSGIFTAIQPSDAQQNSVSDPGNPLSWGSVISKDGKKGIRGYKPQDFQEEFPSLGARDAQACLLQKADQQQQNLSTTSTEQLYGPGPSLRPQNVGSWKDGGGSLSRPSAIESEPKMSENQEKEISSMSVRQMSINGGSKLLPASQLPSTPPVGPRETMPQYGYGRLPTNGSGPNYAGNIHSVSSQSSSSFNHYPEKRVPTGNRGSGPNRRDDTPRPAIISEKTLMQMDNLENDLDDSGWAGAPKEVDYGEKLVFSDDEGHNISKSKRERKSDTDTHLRAEDDFRLTEERHQLKICKDGRPRQAWLQESSNMQNMLPVQNQGIRQPWPINHSRQTTQMGPQRWHSHRMPTSGYEAKESPSNFASPKRFVPSHVGGHHILQSPLQSDNSAVEQTVCDTSDVGKNFGISNNEQLGHSSKPINLHPPTSPPMSSPPTTASTVPKAPMQALDEEDVAWHQQRHRQSEKMTNAIERARQRREDDSKSDDERKAAAQEKLRQLEEKIALRKGEPFGKSDDDTALNTAETIKRQRTESESSDGARQGIRSGNSGYTTGAYSSRSTAKNLPPRFQKQEMMRQQENQLQCTANRNLRQPSVHAQIDQRSQLTGPPPIPAFVADSRVIQSSTDRSLNSRIRTDSQGSDRASRDESIQSKQPSYQRSISTDKETTDEKKRPLRKGTIERGRPAFQQNQKSEQGVGKESDYSNETKMHRNENYSIKKTEKQLTENNEESLNNSKDDKQSNQPIHTSSDQIHSSQIDDENQEGKHNFVKKTARYSNQKDQRKYVEQKENNRQQKESSRYGNQKEGKRNEQKDAGRQTDGKYSKRYSNSREIGRNSDSKMRGSETQYESTIENKFVEKPWQLEKKSYQVTHKELNSSCELVNPEVQSHCVFENEKSKLMRENENLKINDSLDINVEKTRRKEPQRRKKELVDSSKRKEKFVERKETKGVSFSPLLKSFTEDKDKTELTETSAWNKPLNAIIPKVNKNANQLNTKGETKEDTKEDQRAIETAQSESKLGLKDGNESKSRFSKDKGHRRENDRRNENYKSDERKVVDSRRIRRDFYPTRGHVRELSNRGRGRFDPSNKGHGRSFAPSMRSRGRGDRGKRSIRDGSNYNSHVGTKKKNESFQEIYSEHETKEKKVAQDNDISADEPLSFPNGNKRMEQKPNQSSIGEHQTDKEGKHKSRKDNSFNNKKYEGWQYDSSKTSKTDSARRGRGGSTKGRGRPVRFGISSKEGYDDESQSKRSEKSNFKIGDNKKIYHGKKFDRRFVKEDEPHMVSRYEKRTVEHRRRQKPERPPRFQKNVKGGLIKGKENEPFGEKVESSSNYDITIQNVVKPLLSHQHSSDQNNEDWETASESSEFSEKNKKDKESLDAVLNVDLDNKIDSVDQRSSIPPAKKSFSNQRPGNERASHSNTEYRMDRNSNNRRDQRGSGHSNRASEPRRNYSKSSNKNNGTRSANSHHNSENGVVRQQQNVLYRLDDITLNSPQGVTNALTDATTKVTVAKKIQDSKARASVDKKRDVLADFDLNNYAGVVIIDNNPEVIVEDPNDLMTPDEGFQEVMSKQTRKKKALQEEERKKQETSVTEAVIKKPKLGTSMKIRHVQGKSHKSIPTKELNSKTELSKSTAKVVNADNVQATNIPTNAFQESSNSVSKTTQVNAWIKPLAVTSIPGMRNRTAADVIVKVEAEQPDSGIELNSDHQASAPSSQTSSPTGDTKEESASGNLLEHVNDKIRQQKSKETGIGNTMNNYNRDVKPDSKFSTSYDSGLSAQIIQTDSVNASNVFLNETKPSSKFQEESHDSSGRNQLEQFEERGRKSQSHQNGSRNIVQSHDNSKSIIAQSTIVGSSQSQGGKHPKSALPKELPNSLAQAQVGLAREPIEMPKSCDSNIDVSRSNIDTGINQQETCDSKPLQIPHTMHRELQINTQSPNSPATEELTKSIKSTKKLWESRKSLGETAVLPGSSSLPVESQVVTATASVQIASSADFTDFQRRQHASEGIALGSQSGVTFGSFGTESDLRNSTDISIQETRASTASTSSSETFVSYSGLALNTGAHQASNSYMVASGYATSLNGFSSAGNNLPFPSVVLTNTIETKPIGGNIAKVPTVGYAQHTQFGSILRPGNASPSILTQGPGNQVPAFQRGDTRMMGSGVTLTGPSIASVIQHQPSNNYQYGIGQTHTIAPSPPVQTSFPPVGFITSQQQPQQQQQNQLQANLGVLSQPLSSSSLSGQTFLGFSSLGFSQGVENPSNASHIGKPPQTGGPSNLAPVTKTVSSLQFNNVPNVNIQPTALYAQKPTTPVGSQQNLIGSTLLPAIQRNIQQAQQQSSFFATNNPVGSLQASNTYFSSLQQQQPTVQTLPLQLTSPANQYQYHSQTPANIHQSSANMNIPSTTMFSNMAPAQNSFSRAMTQTPISSTVSNTFSAPVDKKIEFLASHSIITPHSSERNLSQRFSERAGMPGRMMIEQNRGNLAISDLQQHVDAKPFNPVKRNEMPFQLNLNCPPSNRVAMKSAFGSVPSSFITPNNSESTLQQQQFHQSDMPMRYISSSSNNAALQKGCQNKNVFNISSNPNTSLGTNSSSTAMSAMQTKQQALNSAEAVKLVVQHPSNRNPMKDGSTLRGIAASEVSPFPNPAMSHKPLPFSSSVVGGSMFPMQNPGNVNAFHQANAHLAGNSVTWQPNHGGVSVPNQHRKVVNGKMSSYSTRPPGSKPYEKLNADELKLKQDKEKEALLASTRAFFHGMNQQARPSSSHKDTTDSNSSQTKSN